MKTMKNAFMKQGTPFMCGAIGNAAFVADKITQALHNGADRAILAGLPVTIENSDGTDTNVLSGTNPTSLVATVPATAAAVSGFAMMSLTDLAVGDSVPYTQKGQLFDVALLGSGVITYLPADETLADYQVNDPISWSFTDDELIIGTATGEGANALPIKLLGGLVDGMALKVNADNVVEWTAVKCIRVQL